METPKIPPSEIITQPPHVSFGTDKVPPPAPLYVAPLAQLFVSMNAIGAVGAVTYAVMARLLRFDGVVIPFEQEFQTTFGSFNALIPLAEGFLLQTSVRIVTGAPTIKNGQCFVFMNLRQVPGPTFVDTPLIADYVGLLYIASWPTGSFRKPEEGAGGVRIVFGTDPAAGVEISESVPQSARWRLISFTANLSTSAVVGNRRVTLLHDNGATIYFRTLLSTNIVASTNVFITWADSFPVFANSDNNQMSSLPSRDLLTGGFRIRTNTIGLDPGDNWSAPTYVVEEWVDT